MNSIIDLTSPPPLPIRATPWMSARAVGLLSSLLKDTDRYLEYGAGGSTRFAAAHGLGFIAAVESDQRFLDAVDHHIRLDAPRIDWQPVFVDLGPTGPLGYPKRWRPGPNWIRYPLTPWKRRIDPDLILVDGRFRLACGLAAALHARSGTRVFVDDYAFRPWYWSLGDFMTPIAAAGRARVFEVRAQRPQRLREALRRACRDPR